MSFRIPAAKHLPALTGIRFFLALWVIFSHLIGKGHVYEPIAMLLPEPLQAIARAEALPQGSEPVPEKW